MSRFEKLIETARRGRPPVGDYQPRRVQEAVGRAVAAFEAERMVEDNQPPAKPG